MTSSRPSLPEYKKIEQVFDKYTPTLNSQPKAKKFTIAVVNTVKSWFPSYSKNKYIQNDLEMMKKESIITFKSKLKKILSSNDDDTIPRLMKILDELNKDYEDVKEAELINNSKYGIALRAVASYIISHIKHHELFIKRIARYNKLLKPVHEQFNTAARKGYDPHTDRTLIDKRNRLVMKLAKLGDIDGIKAAKSYGLLNSLEIPGEAFRPKTPYDSELSVALDIIFDIPWILQLNLHEIYNFRINNHRFPATRDEWERRDTIAPGADESKSSASIEADKESKQSAPTEDKKEQPSVVLDAPVSVLPAAVPASVPALVPEGKENKEIQTIAPLKTLVRINSGTDLDLVPAEFVSTNIGDTSSAGHEEKATAVSAVGLFSNSPASAKNKSTESKEVKASPVAQVATRANSTLFTPPSSSGKRGRTKGMQTRSTSPHSP